MHWLILSCYQSGSLRVTETWSCAECFEECFGAENIIILSLKGRDYCPIEIIKGLTDMGQFQYLTNLKGPQVWNYLYTTQLLSLR